MNLNCRMLPALLAACLAGCSMNSGLDPAANMPQAATITVQVDKPGATISPTMWGAFFEDINFGADGGLYAEMVKNRSFEFPDGMMGWQLIQTNVASGEAKVMAYEPARENNAHFLRVTSAKSNGAGRAIGISNEGFRGIGLKANEDYKFSTQIRLTEGNPKITVQLYGEDGTILASVPISIPSRAPNGQNLLGVWSKFETRVVPKATDAHCRLAIFLEGAGSVDFDMVSLFPEKTWMNRPGGLRADMVQKLADMHPGFLRFPGGCVVEGKDLAHRYQWKTTIGPVEDRKLLINRWNTEFPWRPTPDYFQSYGLGFFEYFQLCEDIGAEPLPLVNAGMACQFNSAECVPVADLGPYVQDALDLIEFANGPADSVWGKKRAEMGHPAPFHMKMMGIGNEQWGPTFIERLAVFTKAIKEKHPEIMLVSDAGPSPDDERFEYLWPKLRELKADIVDEHCYANPIWFLANSTRYDNYDRNGPKVFFGEYAAQSVAICSTKNRNNLECALSEAAYMTGLERNADVVRMASYAPLYAHVDAWQWTPDLMWTNNLNVLATPNYYVQQIYATNRGDVILPCTNSAPIREILPAPGRIVWAMDKSEAEIGTIHVENTPPNSPQGAKPAQPAGPDAKSPRSDARHSGDYTITFQARKLAGPDGFTFTFLDDLAGSNVKWILGGWGNTQHGILTHYAEQDQLLSRVPGSIETNRWYDLKIVKKGAHIDCYLDGKLVQSADVLLHKVPALFTSATRDDKTGEIIVKVVNPGNSPFTNTIQLQGAGNLTGSATVTVLTGENNDENTFESPDHVAPKTTKINGVKPQFTYTFVPRSITVLRVGTR